MSRHRRPSWRTTTALLTLMFTRLSAAGGGSSELPAPARTADAGQEIGYRLELVINRRATGLVVPVTGRQGHYLVSSDDLHRAGFPASALSGQQTDVTLIPGVSTDYDSAGQRLLIQVPSDWLPPQLVSGASDRTRFAPLSDSGVLLNYDAYANRTDDSTQLSAWNEIRFFSGAGSLSNSGVLKETLAGRDASDQQGYARYDTAFNNVDEDKALSWTLGDFISGALAWSSSVRMGGFSVNRDFSVRPDIITYPLPTFSGSAAVPTSADLFINGYKSSSTELQPGPFTLTNTPYINGAGEAVLVTTDALGRQVSTTLPFYVASSLLKPGLSDASFSAGALRRNYGNKNFDYGPGGVSATYRYGISDYWTLESHAEGAEYLGLFGLGSQVKAGRLGVINGSYTVSRMYGDAGAQYSLGYQYSNSRVSLAAQHIQRNQRFGNLTLYDVSNTAGGQPEYTLSRSSTQYSASLAMDSYGSLGAAYLDVRSFANDKTRLLNLSWSKGLWRNSSMYLSANRDLSEQNWSFSLSVQIPFNLLDAVNVQYNRNAAGQSQEQINYTHAMPSDGGFSWNLAYARQNTQDDYQQATLTWRDEHVQLQGGVYGSAGNQTQWGEASGSLVMMDGTLLAANKINDAFVVVSTDGYPGVEVNYEHQPIGKTNGAGYLLVPGVASYYPANYGINIMNLPPDIVADKTEQQAAVRRNSGYLLHFPVSRQRAVNVILHDESNRPVALSSVISRPGHADDYVGWDGIAYLTGVEQHNVLHIRTPDGRHCQAALNLPAELQPQLKTYGPLTCHQSSATGAIPHD